MNNLEVKNTAMKKRRRQRMNEANNRLGETRMMNCGEIAFIVEYRSSTDIVIQFKSSGELVNCTYRDFKYGEIKSHFTPTVYGFGIIGLEKTRENGRILKSYQSWFNMIQRCYSKKMQEKYPTYKGCTVCDEWLYYPNFKKWYEENYYEIEGEKMCLDKDILFKRNKIYSPENCVFVPQNINVLFVKSNAIRGCLPIGVNWHKGDKKYQATCSIFETTTNKSKKKYLGCYNTSEEAFNVYKKVKEENIKLVAGYYKEQIPKKLYDAMCKYEVEISD